MGCGRKYPSSCDKSIKVSSSLRPQRIRECAPPPPAHSLDSIIAGCVRRAFFASIIDVAGGEFIGIQAGDASLGIEPMCLFNDKDDHTTLSLKVSQVTIDNVRAKLQESKQRFVEARTRSNR